MRWPGASPDDVGLINSTATEVRGLWRDTGCGIRACAADAGKRKHRQLWREHVGGDEPMDDEYPQELTDGQLDVRYQAFDEDERPIEGQTTSIREMLAEHGDTPGWLCGSDW